ncbi:unnamed protein product [Effrenium voratum]|nr:unnamed protein product [Effrenium voratum]
MPALQAIDGTSFVMLQSTSLKRAGDALPRHAYSQNCLAGKNTPPILQAAAVNPNKKLLLLTAVDEDSKPSASAEAPPLWAVANINVAAAPRVPPVRLLLQAINCKSKTVWKANQLHKARGDVVVPYQGPDIKDDYIHRIFFRVYEQPRQVPRHLLSDWGQLRSWMQSNRLLGEAARRGGGMSEFLLTAVRKRPNVTAFQDPFAVPLPLPRRQRKCDTRDIASGSALNSSQGATHGDTRC